MFAAMALHKSVDIDLYGLKHALDLTFLPNMIGAIPVFETREQAEEYSNGKFEIVEINIKKP